MIRFRTVKQSRVVSRWRGHNTKTQSSNVTKAGYRDGHSGHTCCFIWTAWMSWLQFLRDISSLLSQRYRRQGGWSITSTWSISRGNRLQKKRQNYIIHRVTRLATKKREACETLTFRSAISPLLSKGLRVDGSADISQLWCWSLDATSLILQQRVKD